MMWQHIRERSRLFTTTISNGDARTRCATATATATARRRDGRSSLEGNGANWSHALTVDQNLKKQDWGFCPGIEVVVQLVMMWHIRISSLNH